MQDEMAVLHAGRLARLRQAVLACRSATALLEGWVGGPIRAQRQPGPDVAPPAAFLAALGLAHGESLSYRRVVLRTAAQALCTAENWYIPSRLPPAMQAALRSTDIPFGRITAPLGITRRVLANRTASPDPVLHLHALVLDREGTVLCLVSEAYHTALLDHASPEELP